MKVTNIRKATSLKNLDELSVSAATRKLLKRNFSDYPIEDIVRWGRQMAYGNERRPKDIGIHPKYVLEAVEAMRNAGFIRPADDFALSFQVNAIYMAVYPEYQASLRKEIWQLSNEEYDEFVPLSDREIEAVKYALRECLTEKEFMIVSLRFGLETGQFETLETIGQKLQVTREYARVLEKKAIRKIRRRSALPRLFDSPEWMKERTEQLAAELKELYEDPLFQKERAILRELQNISKTPFKCAEQANKCLDNKASHLTDIEELGLSVRAYNCLKQAKINTVADIIDFPKEEWPEIKYLGTKCLREIEQQMHIHGFCFSIFS